MEVSDRMTTPGEGVDTVLLVEDDALSAASISHSGKTAYEFAALQLNSLTSGRGVR
mgnify:CR=1 FL=1